jgi:CRP-like cAMP-binding protein
VHDGDRTDDVYFIVAGKVRATIYALSGKEVTFRDLGPGDVVGDLSAIDSGPRSATVVAIDESTVLSMSAASFWEVMQDYPAVSAAMLKELTKLVRTLSERVIEYSTLGVQNRLHAELLRLADAAGIADNAARIRPAPTHAEIASRIATHREAVTRELSHLASSGLLERMSGGGLVVKDVARLQRMVDEVKGI